MGMYAVHKDVFHIDFPNKEQYVCGEHDGVSFYEVPEELCQEFEDSFVSLQDHIVNQSVTSQDVFSNHIAIEAMVIESFSIQQDSRVVEYMSVLNPFDLDMGLNRPDDRAMWDQLRLLHKQYDLNIISPRSLVRKEDEQ